MISNAREREVIALRKRKERAKRGRYLAEGPLLLRDLLARRPDLAVYVVADQAEADAQDLPASAEATDESAERNDVDRATPRVANLVARARAQNIEVELAPPRMFADKLASTEQSQGVLAVVEREVFPPIADMLQCDRLRVLVLDGIQDPGNVGTLLRAAAAFAVDLVILGPGCCDAYNPKTVRASAGGILGLPVLTTPRLDDIITLCRAANVPIAISEANAPSFATFEWPPRVALAIGAETRGVSKALAEAATHRLGIPQVPAVESLNAAMAGSILLGHAHALSCEGAPSAPSDPTPARP